MKKKYKIGYTFDKVSGRFSGIEKVYEETKTGNYPCADNVVFEAPPECHKNEYSRWDGNSWLKCIEEGFIAENGIIREMTPVEKIENGLNKLPEGMKIENGDVVAKTLDERLADGELTSEEYNAEIDRMRKARYNKESDPIAMQMLRGEATKEEWLEVIEKIKKELPKK